MRERENNEITEDDKNLENTNQVYLKGRMNRQAGRDIQSYHQDIVTKRVWIIP